jgi:hypothetical protein
MPNTSRDVRDASGWSQRELLGFMEFHSSASPPLAVDLLAVDSLKQFGRLHAINMNLRRISCGDELASCLFWWRLTLHLTVQQHKVVGVEAQSSTGASKVCRCKFISTTRPSVCRVPVDLGRTSQLLLRLVVHALPSLLAILHSSLHVGEMLCRQKITARCGHVRQRYIPPSAAIS